MPEAHGHSASGHVTLGRQQAFLAYGLSKTTREALARAKRSSSRAPPNDIVLANIKAVRHGFGAQECGHPAIAHNSKDIYAQLTPPSAARPLVWHGVWQTTTSMSWSLDDGRLPPPRTPPSTGARRVPSSPSSSPPSPISPTSVLLEPPRSPGLAHRRSRPHSARTDQSVSKHTSRMQRNGTEYSRIRIAESLRPISPRGISRRAGSPPPPLSPPRSPWPDPDDPPASPNQRRSLVASSPYRMYTERSGQRLLW